LKIAIFIWCIKIPRPFTYKILLLFQIIIVNCSYNNILCDLTYFVMTSWRWHCWIYYIIILFRHSMKMVSPRPVLQRLSHRCMFQYLSAMSNIAVSCSRVYNNITPIIRYNILSPLLLLLRLPRTGVIDIPRTIYLVSPKFIQGDPPISMLTPIFHSIKYVFKFWFLKFLNTLKYRIFRKIIC